MAEKIPENIQIAIIKAAAEIGGKALDKIGDPTAVIQRMPEATTAAVLALVGAYREMVKQNP
jgi:hypothetical protein